MNGVPPDDLFKRTAAKKENIGQRYLKKHLN